MHQFKRSLFVLLALILLPLAPARAEPADEILWRGTITVQRVYKASWTNTSSDIPGRLLYGRINKVYTSKIIPSGYGTAREEVIYTRWLWEELVCGPDINGHYSVGVWTTKADAKFTSTYLPFSISVVDTQVGTNFVQHDSLEITEQQTLPCGQPPIEDVYFESNLAYPLDNNGEFTPNSTEIYGMIENPTGENYYYPEYRGYAGFESSTAVTIYNLTGTAVDNTYHSVYDKDAMDTYSDVS